ncbi:MAG: thioredoxin family protein [Marinifilaceae bacterium]
MKYIFFVLSLFICHLLNGQTGGVDFRNITFEQACKDATKEKKLIFMDFQTVWCGPCKMMKKEVFPNPDVAKYMNTNFVSMLIDAEQSEGKELAKKYEIMGYPTFIVTDNKGTELYRHSGFQDALQFVDRIKKGVDKNWSIENVALRYENGERTPELVQEYIQNLLNEKNKTEATQVVNAYFEKLSKKKRRNPENFFIYEKFTSRINDDKAQYVYNNYTLFLKSINPQRVNALLYNWFREEVLLYTSLRTYDKQTQANYNVLKNNIQSIGLDSIGSINALLNIAHQSVTNGIMGYLQGYKDNFELLEGRDHFIMMQQFDLLVGYEPSAKELAVELLKHFLANYTDVISQMLMKDRLYMLEGKDRFTLNAQIDGLVRGEAVVEWEEKGTVSLEKFFFNHGRLQFTVAIHEAVNAKLSIISAESGEQSVNTIPLTLTPNQQTSLKVQYSNNRIKQLD